MSEPDVWTTLEADRMASAYYDPFAGWTPSQIAGGPAQQFPIEAYAPAPYYPPPVPGPLEYLYGAGAEVLSSKPITDLLWEWTREEIGLGKREVQESAGVTVIHSQPPMAGGAPAQPYPLMIPGAPAPPSAVGTGTMILIVAGLVILGGYFLRK